MIRRCGHMLAYKSVTYRSHQRDIMPRRDIEMIRNTISSYTNEEFARFIRRRNHLDMDPLHTALAMDNIEILKYLEFSIKKRGMMEYYLSTTSNHCVDKWAECSNVELEEVIRRIWS